MKTRASFITNSSSCSYIAILPRVDGEELFSDPFNDLDFLHCQGESAIEKYTYWYGDDLSKYFSSGKKVLYLDLEQFEVEKTVEIMKVLNPELEMIRVD